MHAFQRQKARLVGALVALCALLVLASAPASVFGDEAPSSATSPVASGADLSLLKLDGQDDPVEAARPLTYILRVSNLGPSTATQVIVDDTLAAGVTFVGAMGRDWDCVYESETRQVSCVRPSLAAGSTAPDLGIVVTAPMEGGTISSNAVVSASLGDPNMANNTDSEDTTVLPVADLAINVRTSQFGLSFVYSVAVANAGPSTATGVLLQVSLPPGASLISVTPPSPVCGESNGTMVCDLGDLPSSSSAEVTMQVYAAPLTTTPRVTTVDVTSGTRDLNTANNSASQTTTMPWYALYVPIGADYIGKS